MLSKEDKERQLKLKYLELLNALKKDAQAVSLLEDSGIVPPSVNGMVKALASVSTIITKRVNGNKASSATAASSAAATAAQSRVSVAERDANLLRDELVRKRRIQARETTELDIMLTSARKELETLHSNANSKFQTHSQVTAAELKRLQTEHEAEVARLKAELAQAEDELKKQMMKLREVELGQRKRISRLKGEIEGSLKEYDTAMLDLHSQIDSLKKDITHQQPIIATLSTYYEKVDEELERKRKEELLYAKDRNKRKRLDVLVRVVHTGNEGEVRGVEGMSCIADALCQASLSSCSCSLPSSVSAPLQRKIACARKIQRFIRFHKARMAKKLEEEKAAAKKKAKEKKK